MFSLPAKPTDAAKAFETAVKLLFTCDDEITVEGVNVFGSENEVIWLLPCKGALIAL
jgi:hypothetical protein